MPEVLDFDRALVSYVIDTGDILPAVEVGVTAEWFEDPLCSEGWAWLLDHWKSYTTVPSLRAFLTQFPEFEVDNGDDPVDYLVDELRDRRKQSLVETGIALSIDAINAGQSADEVMSIMSTSLIDAGRTAAASRDVNLSETHEQRIADYAEMRANGGGIRGIATGFTLIDRYLSGLLPEQLITFIGLPKAGKSTAVLKMAQNAHDAGYQPLLLGFEMSNAEQQARYDAMVGKVDHTKLLSGSLSDADWARLQEELKARKNMHRFTLSTDSASTVTLSGIAGKLQQYRPDLLVIDGVYMMIDEESGEKNTPQALTNLTRGMKRLAQNYRLPIVITTQVLPWKYRKTTGLTMDAIGYSSSFAQDSDVILGVESVDDNDTMKKMSIVVSRNAPSKAIMLQWDWSRGEFQETEEVDANTVSDSTTALAGKMGYQV